MGYSGGFKIPGHTGTDFKHRKVFSQYDSTKNAIYSQPLGHSNDLKPKLEPQKFRIKNEKSKSEAIIRLLVFLAFFSLLGFGFFSFNYLLSEAFNSSSPRSQLLLEQYQKNERNSGYSMLVATGKQYYKAGKLDDAQAEFIRAIKIKEYGKSAWLGLTNVLNEKCRLYNQYCDEAKENEEFINEIGFLKSTQEK